MTQTTVFFSGNSQAVRIPKEMRLTQHQVDIVRDGHRLIITERPATVQDFLDDLPDYSDLPFFDDASDLPPDPVEEF